MLALDIALFVRNNIIKGTLKGKKITLQVSDLGYLYTLAFRIGTNGSSWISQKKLSEELGVSKRGLRKALNRLVALDLIICEIDKKDSRKNNYRAHPKLINYHQSLSSKK